MAPSKKYMAEQEFRRIALERGELRVQQNSAAATSPSKLLPEMAAKVGGQKLSPMVHAIFQIDCRRIARGSCEFRAQEKAVAAAVASPSKLVREPAAEVGSPKLSPNAQAVIEQRLATAKPCALTEFLQVFGDK